MGRCSYRQVVQVLLYLQTEWSLPIEVPAKSSVLGWVEKLGCYRYEHPPQPPDGPYALLIDESMVIGQQRLIVILGLPAHKTGNQPTRFEQVRRLRMVVKASWSGEAIEAKLRGVVAQMGQPPLYVVSDGVRVLKKAIGNAGLLERYYQHQVVFTQWLAGLAQNKFEHIMTDAAYLLPPRQRSVGRFLNLWKSIQWSQQLLASLTKLTPTEQARFGWLTGFAPLVAELVASFGLARALRVYVQANGLSVASVAHCETLIDASEWLGKRLL